MLAIGYVDRHIEAHAAVPEKHECPQCGKVMEITIVILLNLC